MKQLRVINREEFIEKRRQKIRRKKTPQTNITIEEKEKRNEITLNKKLSQRKRKSLMRLKKRREEIKQQQELKTKYPNFTDQYYKIHKKSPQN